MVAESLPTGLLREGRMMLAALAQDLLEDPTVQLVIPYDQRNTPFTWGGTRVHWLPVATPTDLARALQQGLIDSAAFWPVAPESAGVLARMCAQAEVAGAVVLGSASVAVALTASKLATTQRLMAHGVTAVPTVPVVEFHAQWPAPWVLKPDDGVGCADTRRVENLPELRRLVAPGHIVQPYLVGPAVSLSVLFDHGWARLLCVNRQHLVDAGGVFHLTGITVNGIPDVDGGFAALAGRIAAAIPELRGYAGVDLILTAHGPVVLEINPRLTTSYAGLRLALDCNVARTVLSSLHRPDWLAAIGEIPRRRAVYLDLEQGL